MSANSNNNHNQIKGILNSLSANICLLDENGVIEQVNDSWLNFAKRNNGDLKKNGQGINYLSVCYKAVENGCESASFFIDGLCSVMNNERDYFEFEYPCHSPDVERWFICRVTPYYETIYTSLKRKVVVAHEDITKRKQAEKWLESLYKNSSDGVIQVDNENKVIDINEKFHELFGYCIYEIKWKNIFDVLKIDIANKEQTSHGETNITAEITCYSKTDKPVDVLLKIIPVQIKEELVGNYVIFNDITERKKKEEEIRYLSIHDSLTSLYNRAYLEKELTRLDVKTQLPISIIIADVNGLKLINDTYGHQVGDRALKRVADALRKACRKEDIISRWGGDEFVILLPKTNKQAANQIAERIREVSENIVKKSIKVNFAVGTATKENIDKPFKEIFKEAEDSMYKNKLVEDSSVRNDIISILLGTLKENSGETEEHAKRMRDLCYEFGKALGLDEDELCRLSLLATMHDIGKVIISSDILKKRGPLTEKEWHLIKKHPEVGKRIALNSNNLCHIAEEINSHHERWDGDGYPNGLKGEEIPLLARILLIVDAYDAMTHGRTYKKPVSQQTALSEIKRCAGTQFDPGLVEVFLKIMTR
ncbi:diguanylate cyclase [Natranaerobius thermophilus]|uniref:Diguanylate cyclase and metal dependent phosphohydrolase n=1 Tax=Natranaerobius thermophilus (strain ATCC BAA-1301 / DSM 18059 / JW/NM-WN-LF) TaxID=457570 RepID=B2A7Y1_NATTJ|nr:diguanylate cyclase [Natranaerobius thermophilus]ACB85753.1 diguanylate cyclase and metal dependent phosphohydrolase [Natranaerobius thermophilus JW/NM-WN-LF]